LTLSAAADSLFGREADPPVLEATVDEAQRRAYWRKNLRLMAVLLTVWALVSFGAGILFVEPLNKVVVAGFPLGFWFAQQGSIITFVVLIAIYVTRMDKLDKEFGVEEYEEEVHHS
jgi:putative solute:sodium symporter small subunit